MSWISGLSSKALGKWLEEDRPTLDTERCYNRKQRKIKCTKCADMCEHGVYGGKNPDWSLCENCGLCVAVCPTRALRPSSANLRGMLELAESSAEAVGFSCERGASAANMTVRCLASVPWEMLACIALDHRLYLDITPCAECPDERARGVLTDTLAKLERFLGEERYAERVRLEPTPEHAHAVSRREAFSSIFKRGRRLAAGLVPGDAEGHDTVVDGAIYERLLEAKLRTLAAARADAVAEVGHDADGGTASGTSAVSAVSMTSGSEGSANVEHPFALETLRISTDCWTCGVCEKICPLGAIVIDDAEDDTDVRYVHHSPIKCGRCELCLRICPQHAILGWREVETDDPLGWRTTIVDVTRCEKCGEPIDPTREERLCYTCARPAGLAGSAARRLLGGK